MDIKQFYMDLADWVLTINQKSQSVSSEEYWEYIIDSAGKLSRKHKDGKLVKHIILAHINYLEDS